MLEEVKGGLLREVLKRLVIAEWRTKINFIDLAHELKMDPCTDPRLQRDKDVKPTTLPLRIPTRAHKVSLLSPSVLRVTRFNKCQRHFTLGPISDRKAGRSLLLQMFKFSPTLISPLMVIIAASIHGGLTYTCYLVILTRVLS